MTEPRRSRPLATFGRGLVMGAADVVPGVSGGTMALLLGIYDRFITALASLDQELVVALLGAGTRDGRQRFAEKAEETDLWFLVQLGLGIATAIVAGAHALGTLIEAYPAIMMALFFGLIVVSARLPWRMIREPRNALVIPLLLGAIAAGLLAMLPAQDTNPGLVMLLAAGAFAITAMLLPGISGSALLVLIGVYPVVLDAVRTLRITTLAVFGLGAIIGLLVSSRLIRAALARWADITHALLTGLMIGSVIRVWPWRTEAGFGAGDPAIPTTWLPAVVILVGAALSWVVERAAGRPKPEPLDEPTTA